MARLKTPTVILLLSLCGCARETVAPPPSQDIVLSRETEIIEALVPRQATLDSLLRQHQLSTELIQAVVESATRVFNPRHLRAERPYRLVRSLDGLLQEFEYQIDADRFLRIVNRDRRELEAAVVPYEKEKQVIAIQGTIDADSSSLIAAVNEAGENIQLAMALADIFGGQIDFQSDLQPGDSFDVLFERFVREEEFAGYGAILGARFTADGREHRAFRYVNPATEKAGYYDEDGRSLKRFMLRSPLGFDPRVTSGFSRSRLHPVHRTRRPHLGVDYAARAGSPVVAVADGTVLSAGWAGGGGNQVRIRHTGGYESYYLHLSAFASGIRAGRRVNQGERIGYVGATGTATGPHLDYRLRRNGVFVNPLIEHSRMPPGEPIPATHLETFFAMRDSLQDQLTTRVAAEAPEERPDAVRALR